MFLIEGLMFFLGFMLLVRGEMTLFGRTLRDQRARLAAFILMAPSIIFFFIAFFVAFQFESPDDLMANVDRLSWLTTLEFFGVVAAGGAFAYLLYTTEPDTGDVNRSNTASQVTRPQTVQTTAADPQTTQRTAPAPEPAIPEKTILTVAEAADYLQMSPDDVRQLIYDSKIAAARIGSEYRIATDVVVEYRSQTTGV